MQSKSSNSASAPARCQHLTPGGRQCSSPVAFPDAPRCSRHAFAQPVASVDFSHELVEACGNLQRAQQINYSLIALYKLVAQGRISPRQGAVLGYIGSLVLRSLKSIDYDLDRFEDEDEETEDEAESVGPGTEPLPTTGEEFALQVLDQKSASDASLPTKPEE